MFDTSVTPRWLEHSDRFWYAYQTREGRRFMFVDPVRKTRAPLFDHAKMAATLTSITRIPYDAQHLPFSSVRFVKKDAAFEFDVSVPGDAVIAAPPRPTTTDQNQNGAAQATKGGAVRQQDEFDQPQQRAGQGAAGAAAPRPPRNRTLHFEYDLATARLTLLEDDPHDPRPPRWASFSPDGNTVVFSRKENLYMMDAANFAKAVTKADDASIVETQLTTDGEEHYSYGRSQRDIQNQREQEQQQQQQQQQDNDGGGQDNEERDRDDPTGRMPTVNLVWSRDSNKIALIRRDSRKVADLWVINALGQPRPTLESYRYSMPGEANIPQSELHVFDRTSKQRVAIKEDRFADQGVQIATMPQPNNIQRDPRRPVPAQFLSTDAGKLYFTRLSRDQRRLDVVVADTATGEVKTLIEERLNTYVESKPLRLVNNGAEIDLLVRAGRLGALLPLRRGHRRAEEPDHRRRVRRHRHRGRGREGARALPVGRRAGEGRGPVLHAPLPRRPGRHAASSWSIRAMPRTACRSPSRPATSSTTRHASTARRSRRCSTRSATA